MPVQKRRRKSLWASKIALTWVIFKWHHGSEGVNFCICSTPLQAMGIDMADHLYILLQLLHTHQQASRPPNTLTQRTFTLIDQQAVRAPEVDVVANLHVLQILWHLASLRELGVNILEIHLWTKGAPKLPWKSASSHSVRLCQFPSLVFAWKEPLGQTGKAREQLQWQTGKAREQLQLTPIKNRKIQLSVLFLTLWP